MLHVVLDRQEISKTILEKAFFFIFWCFYLFSVFVLLNFKISDKMPPKKLYLKNKKKWDLAKLENSFLIITFLGGILSLRQVCFFEISIKFSIF
jgi:hypothetical protein